MSEPSEEEQGMATAHFPVAPTPGPGQGQRGTGKLQEVFDRFDT
jgi:hypothetical protein